MEEEAWLQREEVWRTLDWKQQEQEQQQGTGKHQEKDAEAVWKAVDRLTRAWDGREV